MLRKVLILALILVLGALAVYAADDNDSNSNPNANACFEGGSMAGKCNVDRSEERRVGKVGVNWAWECGWYMIRYDVGLFSEVPGRCKTLIPAEVPAASEELSLVLCIQKA